MILRRGQKRRVITGGKSREEDQMQMICMLHVSQYVFFSESDVRRMFGVLPRASWNTARPSAVVSYLSSDRAPPGSFRLRDSTHACSLYYIHLLVPCWYVEPRQTWRNHWVTPRAVKRESDPISATSTSTFQTRQREGMLSLGHKLPSYHNQKRVGKQCV